MFASTRKDPTTIFAGRSRVFVKQNCPRGHDSTKVPYVYVTRDKTSPLKTVALCLFQKSALGVDATMISNGNLQATFCSAFHHIAVPLTALFLLVFVCVLVGFD